MQLAARMRRKGFSKSVALSFAWSYFKNGKSNKIKVVFIKKSTAETVSRQGKILSPEKQKYPHITKYFDEQRKAARAFINANVLHLKSIA